MQPNASLLRLLGQAGVFRYPNDVPYSCKFPGSYSNHLTKVFLSSGTRTRFVLRALKKAGDGYLFGAWINSSNFMSVGISGGVLSIINYVNNTMGFSYHTSVVFRDPVSYNDIVISVDTTSTDRCRLYVNGAQIALNASVTPAQDYQLHWGNSAATHAIGALSSSYESLNGYLADVIVLDNMSVQNGDVSVNDFGQFYQGLWVPKAYTGSYGTNGFRLDFANAVDLGNDVSGNGNDWTVGGSPEQSIDTPTNKCATLNPLTGSGALSNGNLTMAAGERYASLAVSAGKWAWKCSPTSSAAAGVENVATGVETSISMTSGHVYEFFLDLDAGTLKYKDDGGALTDLATGLSGLYYPQCEAAATLQFSGFTPSVAGYKPLMAENLPEPLLPEEIQQLYYQGLHTAATSTATNVDTGITGLADKDFLLVVKDIDATGNWYWIDTVRGLDKVVYSDKADVEATLTDPVTVSGSTLTLPDSLLVDGHDYLVEVFVVAAGHFDIQVVAGNSTARTVSHNLGVVPIYINGKRLDVVANSWRVYHAATGATKEGYLNLTDAFATASTTWNDTAPTSAVFSLGTGATVNATGSNYVFYLWADSGLYKPITYTGNANADGPFVYLGGLAQTINLKNTAQPAEWYVFGSATSPSNPVDKVVNFNDGDYLYPFTLADIVSNGLKMRSSNAKVNGSTNTIIGMAVLGEPIKYSTAR